MGLTELFLITSLFGSAALLLDRPSLDGTCSSWREWKTQFLSGLTCAVNVRCTGIRCSGKTVDRELRSEWLFHHCANPMVVELRLGTSWNRTFAHGEPLVLPRGFPGGDELSRQRIYLRRADEETVMFGLSPLEGPGTSSPIKVRRCKSKQRRETRWYRDAPPQETGGQRCDLGVLGQCSEHQMCDQVRNSEPPHGVCICLPDYHWDKDLVCAPIVPSTDAAAKNGTGNQPSSTSTSLVTAVQIVVPLVLIAAIAALAVLAYKHRWVPRLRARLRRPVSHVYEEMIIDGDEESSSINSMNTDPVV